MNASISFKIGQCEHKLRVLKDSYMYVPTDVVLIIIIHREKIMDNNYPSLFRSAVSTAWPK